MSTNLLNTNLQPSPTRPPYTDGWFRRWGKLLLAGFVLLLLLGLVYMGSRVLDYYHQIQTGRVDLSKFQSNSITPSSQHGQVAGNINPYVNNVDQDPAIGPTNAKLTIVAFEDFACPNCGIAFPIVQKILSAYSNQIRFVYRDFPISDSHPDAAKAAEAGQCAQEQQQFWPYYDLLYAHQEHLSINDLKAYARQLHLNGGQFDSCLDSGKYTDEVQADFEDGLRAGVTGTPTFFFNGNKVAGAIPENAFHQIIDYFLHR